VPADAPRTAVQDAHSQAAHKIRLDWGPTGATAISSTADIAVVVDVLSFTTTLSIATSRGTTVHPFPWKDDRAAAFADDKHAVLAVGRFEARKLGDGAPSLSPAQLLTSEPVARLVLPSPNGSTICSALQATSQDLTVVGASLRNRTAIAEWLAPLVDAGRTVAFVPAGERWPDDSLRPALEDLWGAGAVLAHLAELQQISPPTSPEADHARSSYRLVADDLATALNTWPAGRS
jgi:2-phosphosulfolactate phosphatase